MKKSTIVCLIFIAALIIAGVLYCVNGIHNYMMAADGVTYEDMSDEDKQKYTSMVLIPDLKDCCVRYNIRSSGAPRDGKWKRVIVECTSIEDLPEAYQEPVRAALDSEKTISTTDLDHNHITVYTVEEGMPLADKNELSPEYRSLADRVEKTYYQVMVYPDGTQKFMFWFEYH